MKKYIGILAVLMISAPTLAAGKLVAKCSSGEEVNLTLKQVGLDSYEASVITQSVGDSYPEFHYKNLRLQPAVPGRLGAPESYQSKDVKLSINFTTAERIAYLSIPDLGLDQVELNCN